MSTSGNDKCAFFFLAVARSRTQLTVESQVRYLKGQMSKEISTRLFPCAMLVNNSWQVRCTDTDIQGDTCITTWLHYWQIESWCINTVTEIYNENVSEQRDTVPSLLRNISCTTADIQRLHTISAWPTKSCTNRDTLRDTVRGWTQTQVDQMGLNRHTNRALYRQCHTSIP